MSGPDIRFMREAIRLARKGGTKVFPNPRVGCVIVNEGKIVGRGYHAHFGGPHAEIEALSRAGARAKGATAYVTLEPCCHAEKKTPPCVPALVRAGIRRVVAGERDPNPKVAGRGLSMLRRAGVSTGTGTLRNDCRALIRDFAANVARARPTVILKAAASLDGRIATREGDSKWITSSAARRLGHRLRAECDAVLVGIGTVLADDPSLTSHGAGRNPLRVVLDSRLRTPRLAKVLDGSASTIILTRPGTAHRHSGVSRNPDGSWPSGPRLSPERLGYPIIVSVPDLRPATVLAKLAGMGVGRLLIEGGGRVATSFLEAGLVDELRLFIAPKLIGGRAAPSFFEGIGASRIERAVGLDRARWRRVGPDLLVEGRLRFGR